ncbi:translation initiation factor IF-2 [Bos taurus]|uniref:translation initiation factor IF-2 n=1 Tax=Bos taurus TaxID=9913 RepID=UPI0028CB842A|nr:translation initiation factor IF-2 [Bos taurus]
MTSPVTRCSPRQSACAAAVPGNKSRGGLLSFALLPARLFFGYSPRRPPASAHDRELAGSREAAGCEVPVAAEAPRPALRSFNPRRGARDDDKAGKVRRARREAAWHAQCSRLWVFSEVAQTLLGRRVYSAEGNPAAARCSSRPGRIQAPRPARTRPAPPARPLRTLSQSLSVDPLSFLLFVCLSSKGAPARSKSRRRLSCRGQAEVPVGGAVPARSCEGGSGAVGCLGDAGHRVPAAAAAAAAPAAAAPAAAAPAAAAARASRAGYINTRFHTPELTSAGPAQHRAGGGRERGAGRGREPVWWRGVGGRPSSANRLRRAQRGVLTRSLPRAYGSAAPDRPSHPVPLSSPTPLASISAVSPVSPPIHPHHSSASRVLPGSVRNCSWRSRGMPKPANGKQRDAEIGTVDGK